MSSHRPKSNSQRMNERGILQDGGAPRYRQPTSPTNAFRCAGSVVENWKHDHTRPVPPASKIQDSVLLDQRWRSLFLIALYDRAPMQHVTISCSKNECSHCWINDSSREPSNDQLQARRSFLLDFFRRIVFNYMSSTYSKHAWWTLMLEEARR